MHGYNYHAVENNIMYMHTATTIIIILYDDALSTCICNYISYQSKVKKPCHVSLEKFIKIYAFTKWS